MVAAVSAVAIEIVAVVVATLSIRRLAVSQADSPRAAIASSVAGTVGSKILIAGVVVAMFDTGLSANLGYARVYFASGATGCGRPRCDLLASTNRNQVPKWAFAFLGIACGVLLLDVADLTDHIHQRDDRRHLSADRCLGTCQSPARGNR